jgi:hypothetical protein
MPDTKQVSLTLDLINSVMNYLGGRPYQEVFALIQEIQKQAQPQLQPAQPQTPREDA